MGGYEEFEERWNAQQCGSKRYPKLSHPIPAQPFLAQLRFLHDVTRERYHAAVFADALAAIEELNLIGRDGQWHDHWLRRTEPDPASIDDRLAVLLVEQLISAGHSETDAVAFVVMDQELPGANFKAAWTRLRRLYYKSNPTRARRKRGRPRRS